MTTMPYQLPADPSATCLAASDLCRYCGKPVAEYDRIVTHSYWQAFQFVCHKACKSPGEKLEAFDCQSLDADCNDCRHFRRGVQLGKWVSVGHCLKFNRPTKAYPNFCTGWSCFEHRRTAPC